MKEPKINISIGISQKLLRAIEQNIEGSSRSEKLAKCARIGYAQLHGE